MHNKRKYEVAMVLGMAGLYFFSFFQRVAIPGTIFNELQSQYSISAAAVTRLSAIYLFVYASMQVFAGLLADRFGGIKVIIISGCLLFAGSLLFPFSEGQTELYLSRALVGLGASMMYLCIVKETDHYFRGKNFAPVFGLICFIGYSGGLVGTRPFRGLVEHTNWQTACIYVAAATFVVLVFCWIMMQKVSREDTVKKDSELLPSIMEILKNKISYPLLLTTPVCYSIYFTIQATIGIKFLEDFCEISPVAASNYTFVMMFCTISSMMLSGYISKLIGNKRKIFVLFNGISTMLAMLLLLCGVIFKLPPLFFLPGYILPAINAGYTPVNVSLMKEYNRSDKAAVSIGVMNTVTYVVVALMSQLTGRLLDLFKDKAIVVEGATIYPQTAYVTLFSFLLAVSLIPLAASFFCRETNGNNIYK